MAPSLVTVYKYYCLLDAELRGQGRPLTKSERDFLEYAIAFDHHKKLTAYCKRQALLALRRQNFRRWHVRPIFQDREIYGAWFNLIPLMRESDPEEYFRFLRMTPDCFDWVLEKVEPFIRKKSRRQSISAGERLAVTLRYLASGDSHQSLSYLFRMSNQVISKIVTETTAVIWYTLKPIVFEEITEDFWRRKASEFESMWQFPMCVGAIDGKHCNFQKFPKRGSEFYNYKGANSIILFAVADATYKFIVVDCGARGRESDGGVFDRCQFGKLFKEGRLRLPSPVYNEKIDCMLPYVFLGDDAFSLHQNLMKPYTEPEKGEKLLPPEQTVFNYRLSRARRVVENSFGILSARFRILRRCPIASETLAQNIILSTVALHNLHLMREDSIPPKQRLYMPPGFADTYRSNGVLKKGRWRNKEVSMEKSIFQKLARQEVHHAAGNPKRVRDDFNELIIAEPLPWQWDLLL